MKSQTKIRFQLTNSFSSSTHSRFSQRGSWQQSEDHQSVRGLFAEGSSTSQPLSSNLQRAAIIQTRAWMLCFWLARVRHFPLWPIMLAFLLLSCGILGGGHFCLPPSPTLLLTKCIWISCSKNSIKLCKGQKQADFKGAGWGGMLHTKAPDTSFSTQTPCTSKTDPASWNKARSWTWSLISGVLALLLLCFVRLDGATLCSKPWPLQPTLFAWGSTHSHTCRQSQTAIKQEVRRKLIRGKNQCADNTVSSLTDYRHRECCCCLFW